MRDVEAGIELSYGRANKLVSDLVDIGVLAPRAPAGQYRRRFYSPAVLKVLLRT